MSAKEWDFAVLGGGPAGIACALSLRTLRPEARVAVFESSEYGRSRAGEVLPPQALPLLRRLQIPLEPMKEFTLPAESLASAWGGEELAEQHHLFFGHGAGMHLDRRAFDEYLEKCAEKLGVAVYTRATFQSAVRKGEIWQLTVVGVGECSARFVVDATGRRASFARLQGARVQHFDVLTAYSRIVSGVSESARRTVIEACALGWWYSAPLPHGLRVVSLMTDVDLARGEGLPERGTWERMFDRTRHIVPLIAGAAMQEVEENIAPASTGRLSAFGGEGWLAAGDAAVSCDPLAGQGITKALHSGIFAAYAAVDSTEGKAEEALERYSALTAAHFSSFQRVHRAHHLREMRWAGQPFWQRRQSSYVSDAALTEVA